MINDMDNSSNQGSKTNCDWFSTARVTLHRHCKALKVPAQGKYNVTEKGLFLTLLLFCNSLIKILTVIYSNNTKHE